MPHTILIVDDSPDVCSIVKTFLQRDAEFRICGEAGTGLEAIKKAEKLRPDLVLLDLKMPGMNGIEVASILKRVLPKAQIVLFSAYTDALGGTTLTTAAGIDLVVQKGSLADMAQSLRTLISRKWMSPVNDPSEPSI
ncbi:MAG: DNA-binding response regulator [Candidatus Acidoferrum typicum]|nr:DNA-binding response regulator [Candidatus Acidoferrum typicum]